MAGRKGGSKNKIKYDGSLQFSIDILSESKSWIHKCHFMSSASIYYSPAVYDPLLRSRYVQVESLYVRQDG